MLAFGQATFTLTGPPNLRGGVQSFVSVNLSLSGTATVAAYQFDLNWPAGWTITKGEAGAATTAAGKTLTCRTDYSRCIAWGINASTVAAGTLATFTVTAPLNQPAGTGPSLQPFAIIAANPDGVEVASTMGPAWTPNFFARQDANGDGAINVLDIQYLLPYVLGSNPSSCPVEQDADGVCTVLDVQIVAKAALR